MASKQPLKLFDVKKKLYNAFLKVESFMWHSVLRNKRKVVIIGEADTPVFKRMHEKLNKNWIITHLQCDNKPHKSKDEKIKSSQQNRPQTNLGESNLQSKNSHFHFEQLSLSNNYAEIEKKLLGQQFNSIIVLPEKENPSNCFNIEDEQFVTHYPTIHENLLMRNIFAYRLAHKFLSKNGVIILSCGEKQFVKHKQQLSKMDKRQEEIVNETTRKYWTSTQLINSQISYLGFIIGDRQYIPLNSHSVIALSKEISNFDPDFVSDCYLNWMSQNCLPAAGSFALFRNQSQNSRSVYLEYL